RHDQIEIEPFQVLQFLEGDRLVPRDIDADLLQSGDRERIKFTLLHAGGSDSDGLPEHLLRKACGHRRAHRIHAPGKYYRLGARWALGYCHYGFSLRMT